MKKLLMIFGLAIIVFNCNSTKKVVVEKEGVDFVNSDKLTTVMEMATTKDKLVFVDFYTTWCLPCKMMDEDVFPDKGIAELMNDNFVNYKVNAEKDNGPTLALLYQINVYPTLLFLDQEGKVLVRKEGAAYPTELRNLAEEAISTNSANVGDD